MTQVKIDLIAKNLGWEENADGNYVVTLPNGFQHLIISVADAASFAEAAFAEKEWFVYQGPFNICITHGGPEHHKASKQFSYTPTLPGSKAEAILDACLELIARGV